MVVKRGAEFKPNCFGFVWSKLGLDCDDHLLPSREDVYKAFRPVTAGDDPDVLIVNYLYDDEPMHAALMKNQPSGMVWQRDGSGEEPHLVSLETALKPYDPDIPWEKGQHWPGRAEFLKLK